MSDPRSAINRNHSAEANNSCLLHAALSAAKLLVCNTNLNTFMIFSDLLVWTAQLSNCYVVLINKFRAEDIATKLLGSRSLHTLAWKNLRNQTLGPWPNLHLEKNRTELTNRWIKYLKPNDRHKCRTLLFLCTPELNTFQLQSQLEPVESI